MGMCLPRLLVIQLTKRHFNTRCKQGLSVLRICAKMLGHHPWESMLISLTDGFVLVSVNHLVSKYAKDHITFNLSDLFLCKHLIIF